LPDPIVVIGAGIAGVACARELAEADLDYRLLDRGQRLGGRMAVRTIAGRAVDIGASYFTVRTDSFREVVTGWQERDLAREWTDTFAVATPDGIDGPKVGPLRYAARNGLRSLVEDLAAHLAVEHPHEVEQLTHAGDRWLVDGQPAAAVALAMPGPQAADLLPADSPAAGSVGRRWEPTLALITEWPERVWPAIDGAFVNDSALLTFVADDGRRRGDGAAVLVAHAHPVLAAAHLNDPERAIGAMLGEQAAVLGIAPHYEPALVQIKRWSLAKPIDISPAPFHLGPDRLGLAGDGWHGGGRIEAAYLSGRALGRALVRLFT
jgi:predicted NAD/FAD-dependent oxidoreductase